MSVRSEPHASRRQLARGRDVEAARAGWLGALAGDVGLSGALDAYCGRREEVELAIYRAHHAAAVSRASPLALDLLAHLGMDVDGVVDLIRPRADWRRWVNGIWPPRAAGRARWTPSTWRAGEEDERDLFLHGCLVLREWGDPAGALGVRLSPWGLEVGARLGPAHLRTVGGVATITISQPVPETIKAACVGRAVSDVFGHPVLRAGNYVIADQHDRTPTGDDPREAWRIAFAAEPVGWRVPWAPAPAG